MDIRRLSILGLLFVTCAQAGEERVCDSVSQRISEIQQICKADLGSHAGTYFVRTTIGLLPVPTSTVVDSRVTDRYSVRARDWGSGPAEDFHFFLSIFNQFPDKDRLLSEGKLLDKQLMTSLLSARCGVDARVIVYEKETPGGITLRQLYLDIGEQLVSVAYEDRDILQAMVDRLTAISCGVEKEQ